MNDSCPNCSGLMGDADVCPHCGFTRQQGAGDEPRAKGSMQLEGDVQGGIAQQYGVLFVPVSVKGEAMGSRFGRVLAIDPAQMKIRWQQDFPDELINPPILVINDLVIVATRTASALALNASLYALDTATGASRWRWRPDMRALSAPAWAMDRLWTVGSENSVWSLDLHSGQPTGSSPIELGGSQQVAAAAVHGQTLLIPTLDATLIAVDGGTGSVRWRYRHATDAWASTPLVCGNCVITPFTDGSLALIDANSGKLGWARTDLGKSLPSMTSNGEVLFVGCESGIVALNLADGAERWRHASERKVTAQPLLHENALIVAGHDHTVRAFDPFDGDELWQWQGERRIEADPMPTPTGLAILDAGDALTLLELPQRQLSPQQAMAAGDWRMAAELMEQQGEVVKAAKMLEERDDALGAARLWLRSGDVAKAIEQFQSADTVEGWAEIAVLQENTGDFTARAVALHRVAELQDTAEAWQQARQAYLDAGMSKEAAASWREICRLLRYPFVRIEAVPEAGFVKEQFNILRLLVHNEGQGIAAAVSARATGTGFSGEHMQTTELGNLGPGNSMDLPLGLRPTSAGKVPLTLEVGFLLGLRGAPHDVSLSVFVDVASHEDYRQSSSDLADQINEGFDVIERSSFRRSEDEIYRQQLENVQRSLAKRELQRDQYGIAAPLWLENEIDMLKEREAEIKRTLDDLVAESNAKEGAGGSV
ncbi:MAG: PQQ-binding-like beta-propeller repeat protein [Caldilineales bacterium]|nr:PQQ-binding-like beta-propeller repeat protein [Caldilineales bacterium]